PAAPLAPCHSPSRHDLQLRRANREPGSIDARTRLLFPRRPADRAKGAALQAKSRATRRSRRQPFLRWCPHGQPPLPPPPLLAAAAHLAPPRCVITASSTAFDRSPPSLDSEISESLLAP